LTEADGDMKKALAILKKTSSDIALKKADRNAKDGAVMLKTQLSEASAILAKSYTEWLRSTWDTDNDNIFLWDFYDLETEGGLYLKPEYSTGINNSHPNEFFAQKVAPLFCQRIVDVIENSGKKTSLDGSIK
jgi:hypothetical protein